MPSRISEVFRFRREDLDKFLEKRRADVAYRG
jgi:hypothetical protein